MFGPSFCNEINTDLASFPIISLRKRVLLASIYLYTCYHVTISVLCIFLAVPFVIMSAVVVAVPGLEVIKLKYSLKLKIKRIDWLLADTCPQAANHCALFWV